MRIMYIILNAAGERLYQYPATEYIDVAERYKRDYFNKTGRACRIATKEMAEGGAECSPKLVYKKA